MQEESNYPYNSPVLSYVLYSTDLIHGLCRESVLALGLLNQGTRNIWLCDRYTKMLFFALLFLSRGPGWYVTKTAYYLLSSSPWTTAEHYQAAQAYWLTQPIALNFSAYGTFALSASGKVYVSYCQWCSFASHGPRCYRELQMPCNTKFCLGLGSLNTS